MEAEQTLDDLLEALGLITEARRLNTPATSIYLDPKPMLTRLSGALKRELTVLEARKIETRRRLEEVHTYLRDLADLENES